MHVQNLTWRINVGNRLYYATLSVTLCTMLRFTAGVVHDLGILSVALRQVLLSV